ncbi:MAG: RsmD family RNA methyltransferase [Synechococcus sp.]|nr:RsmD family RNA methyltransferase [Synechococcus sp.]
MAHLAGDRSPSPGAVTLRLSGGRRLQSPPGVTARPTAARVRQAVMNLLAADLPGSHWLDLCCGSGVMACEALQRGAIRVVAIERDRRVAAVARANLEAVAGSLRGSGAVPELRVIQADALHWLSRSAPGGRRRQGRDDQQRMAPAAAGTPHRRTRAATDEPRPGGRAADAAVPGGRPDHGGEGQDPAAAIESQPHRLGPPAPAAAAAEPFDLIYVDPPWPAGLHGRLSEAVLQGGWIRAGGRLVWECPSDQAPLPPAGWRLHDRRRYGGSTVMILQPL